MPLLYSAYGVCLEASRPIPGLVPLRESFNAHLKVRLGEAPRGLATTREWYRSEYKDESGIPVLTVWELEEGRFFRFRYTDHTEFVIDRSGTEVWATWPDDLTIEDTSTYLLGPVMGFVLLLRGITSLHASAVAINDRAVALVGPAGVGKSTIAAVFARLGFAVLSEDVVALSQTDDGFFVQPGYPLIRLWADSVRALFGDEDALPLLTPNWDKQYLDLTSAGYRFQKHPLPLAAVYIIGERSPEQAAPFVTRMPAKEKVINLIANTYTAYLVRAEMRERQFQLLSRVAQTIPIRQLTPHTDIKRLPDLCKMIAVDFEAISDSSTIIAGA
jgi:hypothetical protein